MVCKKVEKLDAIVKRMVKDRLTIWLRRIKPKINVSRRKTIFKVLIINIKII